MTPVAVSVDGVSKRFVRHLDRRTSVKERLFRGRSRNVQDFWALRDVTFSIPKGSVFGLIGHNGCGKSTLLKMIGGIYRPTNGSIVTEGRVASLIELGAGFHPDLTGRENIALNGSIIGLSKREIAAVTDEIIDFSGIRTFIDDPVKHYSSGMYVRLGFSVAVHMKPEILLVDEVLAVGDEEFQRKCFDHLSLLRRSGTTMIVVSHALGQLEALCDQIAWLDHGMLQQLGRPTQVTGAYLAKVNADESSRNPVAAAQRERDDESSGALKVASAAVLSADGVPLDHAETGSTFAVRVSIDVTERILGPNVRLALQHESGPLVTMVSNHDREFDLGWLDPGRVELDVLLDGNPLLPGRYRVHIDVFDHTGVRRLDNWDDALEFPVRSARGELGQGFVRLPASFRAEHKA